MNEDKSQGFKKDQSEQEEDQAENSPVYHDINQGSRQREEEEQKEEEEARS